MSLIDTFPRRIGAVLWLGILCASIAVLAGCGGGSGSTAQGGGLKNDGRVTFLLQWPAGPAPGKAIAASSASRFVPGSTLSYGIVIKDGDTVLDKAPVTRPANGGAVSIEFKGLPVGTLTAVVSTYDVVITDAINPGRVATASVTKSFDTVKTGGPTKTESFTLTSTVQRLNVEPATLAAGSGLFTLKVDPVDSAGNTVISSTSTLKVETSDPNVFTVADPTLTAITPVAAGTATVTVTYTEKDINGQTVSVQGTSQIKVVAGGGNTGGNGTGIGHIKIQGDTTGLPTGIQSMVVKVDGASPGMLVTWPGGSQNVSIFTDTLSAGAHAISITAKSNPDGSGIDVGSVSDSVTIESGKVAEKTVALANAVTAIQLGVIDATNGSALNKDTLTSGQTNAKVDVKGTTALNPGGASLTGQKAGAFLLSATQTTAAGPLQTANPALVAVTIDPDSGALSLKNGVDRDLSFNVTATDRYNPTRQATLAITVKANTGGSTGVIIH